MDPIKPGEIYVGFLNYATMLSSNYALNFVNFPVQALVKSCKILPVMLTGIIWGVYSYPWTKYFNAFMVTVGLVIFNLGKSSKDDLDVEFIGGFLLFISLLFDGLIQT